MALRVDCHLKVIEVSDPLCFCDLAVVCNSALHEMSCNLYSMACGVSFGCCVYRTRRGGNGAPFPVVQALFGNGLPPKYNLQPPGKELSVDFSLQTCVHTSLHSVIWRVPVQLMLTPTCTALQNRASEPGLYPLVARLLGRCCPLGKSKHAAA